MAMKRIRTSLQVCRVFKPTVAHHHDAAALILIIVFRINCKGSTAKVPGVSVQASVRSMPRQSRPRARSATGGSPAPWRGLRGSGAPWEQQSRAGPLTFLGRREEGQSSLDAERPCSSSQTAGRPAHRRGPGGPDRGRRRPHPRAHGRGQRHERRRSCLKGPETGQGGVPGSGLSRCGRAFAQLESCWTTERTRSE